MTGAAQVTKSLDELLAGEYLTDLSGRRLAVVHRDVSPHNILLSFDGAVKVIDFGIALTTDRTAPTTAVGGRKGKLACMSPEQVLGHPVDARSDIFSAGVVLYDLLSRKRPYVGANPLALGEAFRDTRPAPPSTVSPRIPQVIDDIVLRAVRTDPEERFNSAKEMAKALEEVVRGEGGADLEEFAAAHLRDAQEKHRRWLLRFNSRHALAYRSLGIVYSKLGNTKAAISAYTRFLELEPNHKDAPRLRELLAKYREQAEK